MAKFANITLGLIDAVGDGIVGRPIPETLHHVEPPRLQWDGSAIVDAAAHQGVYYIDEGGQKHVAAHTPSWSPLDCAWSDPIIKGADGWRVKTLADELPPLIRAECSRRIDAIYKDDVTQRNMSAHATRLTRHEAAGTISAQDKAVLDLMELGLDWVASMLATCRALITDADTDYGDDAKWPAAPAGLKHVADQF